MSNVTLDAMDPTILRRLEASTIMQKIQPGPDRVKLLALCGAVAEAINSLPNGVPSGHLYAALMGQMALLDYQLILSVLKVADMIRVESHYITWVPE